MPNKKGLEVPEADVSIEIGENIGKMDCENCVLAEKDIMQIIDNMGCAEVLSVNGVASIVTDAGLNKLIQGRAKIIVIKEA